MTTMTPVPNNDPLMLAWQAYKSSPEYLNSWTWAAEIKHRDGSMWAAFVQGWNSAKQFYEELLLKQ